MACRVTYEPRKPRAFKPRSLNVLVADANTFSRSLMGEILRNLGITNIYSARTAAMAISLLHEREVHVILLSGDDGDAFDALGFVRTLRRLDDDRFCRMPVVLVTAGLTRQLVIGGRDAGIDEFLTRPIAPVALRQRLEMVIETPRPFINSPIYLGPCRRRKNPADYHGAKRRAGEAAERAPMVDHDELARETPIRQTLSRLREFCALLRTGRLQALEPAIGQIKTAKELAIAANDRALHGGLVSFETYIVAAAPLGRIDEATLGEALTALEQLAALPLTFAEARDNVANVLSQAIQKKTAA